MIDHGSRLLVLEEAELGPSGVTVLTDWELWACARQQITQHGDDAATQAAMRCDSLLAEGNASGHRAWLAILDRIGQLNGVRENEVRH